MLTVYAADGEDCRVGIDTSDRGGVRGRVNGVAEVGRILRHYVPQNDKTKTSFPRKRESRGWSGESLYLFFFQTVPRGVSSRMIPCAASSFLMASACWNFFSPRSRARSSIN
jgi:hypothetical protein